MSLPHPDEVRAALSSAQTRATEDVQTIKRRFRKWILLAVGAFVFTLVGLTVALVLLYQQSTNIVALQRTQAENSANGRTLLAKVVAITEQIAAFSDPNSQAAKEQQAKTGQVLAQLDEAARLGRADQLKKIAQMFEQCRSLPCDPAIVNRILAQPVPVPTFGGAKPAAARTMRSVGIPAAAPLPPVPSPSSSSTSCPGIQVAPLNVVQICIPPPH